jgi:Rho-binding antiterminator
VPVLQNPLYLWSWPLNDYRPINCEFHDLLEALATTRKPAQVEFLQDGATKAVLVGQIKDVYAKDGVEYLELDSGEKVRLDKLVAVNGSKESDFEAL